MELQVRSLGARFRKDPGRLWLRWARQAHHGDVALVCLDRAMGLGEVDALYEHALLESEGFFGAAEPALNFRRAAERGHLEAMVRLADCLRWGPGRERDPQQAKAWLLRGAQAGFRPAAESLARWMEETGDPEAGLWKERAAHMAPLRLRSGLLKPMESRDPLVRAQAAAELATDRGFEVLLRQPWAPVLFTVLLVLALLILVGAFLFLCVASLGLLPAGLLAYAAIFGRRQRHQWRYRRLVDAAEGGDPDAAFELGQVYLNGKHGLAPDALSAAVWFRRAAENGHRGAMTALAEALRTGHGLRRDVQEADLWARAAG